MDLDLDLDLDLAMAEILEVKVLLEATEVHIHNQCQFADPNSIRTLVRIDPHRPTAHIKTKYVKCITEDFPITMAMTANRAQEGSDNMLLLTLLMLNR